jgi:hypothetical protein
MSAPRKLDVINSELRPLRRLQRENRPGRMSSCQSAPAPLRRASQDRSAGASTPWLKLISARQRVTSPMTPHSNRDPFHTHIPQHREPVPHRGQEAVKVNHIYRCLNFATV